MPIPAYGAPPMSKLFALVRVAQVAAMVIAIGIMANFVSEIVDNGVDPPQEVVGTLSVASIATLYTLLSLTFFYAEARLGLLIMAALDALLLIAFIVVAVCLGRPLSFLNCANAPTASAAATANLAYTYVTSVEGALGQDGAGLTMEAWAGATRENCVEGKAVWGVSIVLCILFTTSCVLLPTLFMKNKKANAAFAAAAAKEEC